MRPWPRWMLDGEPAGLVKYVQPEVVKGLIGLPGPSAEPVLDRLGQIYDAFAARRIRYAWEEYSDEPGRQVIRPPDQVLRYPGHGTCLDLAVTFAAACQVAGLRSVIVIVKPEQPGPLHAVVAVWLAPEGVQYPLGEKVYREPPADLVDEIQAELGGPPGRFAVIDVAGVCPAQPRSPARGLGAGFADAVRQGAGYLTADTWAWWLGVDVSAVWRAGDVLPVPAQPLTSPLREPYLDPAGVESPLRLIRADYDVVPFQDRDELTVLDDCCRAALELPAVKVAVVHGVGGSGKTRLAIELAAQLGGQGWYAGLLRPGCGETDIAWLAAVASPLFVVVDYAETRSEQLRWLFGALRHRADLPTVVILTARSTLWWDQLAEELANDAIPYRLVRQMALERRHGDSGRVFRAAFHAFSAAPAAAPGVTVSPRWTTLDFVLLAWLAANDQGELPQTRSELYRAAMRHEYSYWRRTYGGTDDALPERSVFYEAAVCLTLLSAADSRAGMLLGAVAELGRDGAALNRMSRTLKTCIGEPDGRLTLRPDPVADQLTVDVLSASPGLLGSLLPLINDDERAALAVSLNRAGAADEALATAQLRAAIGIDRQLLEPALQVATLQGGPALTALEQLAADRGSELPADLDDQVPDHILLRGLRWRLAERRLAAVLEDPEAEPQAIGALLDRVATAASAAGQHERGLEAARQDSAEACLPSGDRAGALPPSEGQSPRPGRSPPEVFLPDLATSLNNLSIRQSDNGDRAGALTSIQEAVQLRRTLAEARPEVFLPDLATSLNNLSNQQSDNGDRAGALTSIQEAVQLRRALAEARPEVFLPDLATSLNNLSIRQSDNGDRAGALTSIQEAVQLRRALAEARPEVFLPDLATSLNNLSIQQSDNGDRAGALTSIQEAVQLRRALAEARPEVFLPDLAMSLNNLADILTARDETPAISQICAVIETLTDPLSRAELRARTAEWCLANHQPADAASLVTQGVGEAQGGEPRRLGQARRALREVATRLDDLLGSDELPPWAVAPLEASQADLISQWTATTTWTEEATLLRQRQPDILSPAFPGTLKLLEELYPAHPGLARIRSLLDLITSEGFDRALAGLDSADQVTRLVSDWIATETWDDSKRYLDDHREELHSQEAMALLADQTDNAEVLSHLGILHLDQALGLDATYTVVTDPTAGEAYIDQAIRTGSTELLQAIAMAAPHLLERPVTGHLIIAVLALTADDQPTAETHAQAAADSAAPLRREAITIHLRGLAAARPEHREAITKLIEIFAHAD